MNDWIDNDETMPSVALVDVMFYDGEIKLSKTPASYAWRKDSCIPIKAWRPSYPDENRIDVIAQNGNDGDHYKTQVDIENNDIPNVSSKVDYYLDESGEDWLDECARTLSSQEYRGAMKFVIGKYLRRLGKKDNTVQELAKVADYTNRWIQYENNLKK